MSTLFQRHIASQIVQVFSKKPARHVAIWVIFTALLIIIDNKEYGLFNAVSRNVVNVAFYVLIVYFNLHYLIPHYLTQRTVFKYLGALLLSVIVITPIKAIALYFLFQQASHREFVTFNQQWIFVLTLLVALTSTVGKILNDWMRHQRDRKELETQTMQSELKLLKSQINPHFLFNTLNSLYALTLKKSDAAPEIVIKLSEMMRYMLYECNERLVPLRKEVQYIKNYLDLERLRQGQKVQITFEIRGEIRDQLIAPMIFTPFLENSFKHGASQIAEGYVHITLDIKDSQVGLCIENSKPAVRPVINHGKPSGGIGLVNVQRRLDLIYPDNYALKIDDAPDRYRVSLDLALMQPNE